MAISPIIAKGQPRAHKRTDLLVAVLLTFLGGAVLVIAFLASVIEKRDQTIKALTARTQGEAAAHSLDFYESHGGNLPVVATSRRALSGSGFVLSIRNLCTEELPLVVSLETPGTGRRKTSSVSIEPEHTAEFGHFDEWKLSAGDVVELSHEGFSPVTMRFK